MLPTCINDTILTEYVSTNHIRSLVHRCASINKHPFRTSKIITSDTNVSIPKSKKIADLWSKILHEDVAQNQSEHQLSHVDPTVHITRPSRHFTQTLHSILHHHLIIHQE